MKHLSCRITDDGTPEWVLFPPDADTRYALSLDVCYVPLRRFYPAYQEALTDIQRRNPDVPIAVAVNVVLARLWERRGELEVSET